MLSAVSDSAKVVIATLQDLASQEISNTEMLTRVRELHPAVTLQDIVRAAFYAVSDPSLSAAQSVSSIYDFARAARRTV